MGAPQFMTQTSYKIKLKNENNLARENILLTFSRLARQLTLPNIMEPLAINIYWGGFSHYLA
jgi:hypothetical protein